MRLTRQRRQLVIITFIVLVALAGGVYAAGTGVLDDSLQAGFYDFAISNAPTPPKNQLTIVAIDNYTVDKYGRWPLPRRAYAELLQALKGLDQPPTVVGFDVAFYDPSDRPDDDAAFAAQIKASGNVVLAMQGDGTAAHGAGALRFQRKKVPLQIFRDPALAIASVDVLPEFDGKVRRAPLVVEAGGERFLSLPLTVAARKVRGELDKLRYDGENVVVPAPLGPRVIPVDAAGEMRVHFTAPPATDLGIQHDRKLPPCSLATEFCVVSLADVVEKKVPASLLSNRIVLIGAHSLSAAADDYAVPNSENAKMYGVEIWANSALSILANRFPILREDTPPTVLWLTLVTLLGVGLIVRYRLIGFFAALFVLVAYGAVATGLFVAAMNGTGTIRVPSLAYVAAGAPFWWVVVLGYLLVEEQASVRQTQRAFGLAVTPEIARHILEMQERGSLALGGQLREATVLFGDIRGFTTLSEGMGPADLMATLNRYFDGMVKIVQKDSGTVNKYNGDNIMVIWGAPIDTPDHARKAVECALELQRFIVSEREKGGPDVSFGFGINSGELVAGFLGAQGRFEYTVIGDTVNVASRLTNADIARRDNVAVSERTLRALGGDIEAVDLGHVQVKGRAEPVHCFQVNRLGALASPNPAPPPAEPVRAAAVAGFH